MIDRIWVLGASDPEMAAIEQLLTAADERVAYATVGGVRVHPGAVRPLVERGWPCNGRSYRQGESVIDVHGGGRADLQRRSLGFLAGISGNGLGSGYTGGEQSDKRGCGQASTDQHAYAGAQCEADGNEAVGKGEQEGTELG